MIVQGLIAVPQDSDKPQGQWMDLAAFGIISMQKLPDVLTTCPFRDNQNTNSFEAPFNRPKIIESISSFRVKYTSVTSLP